MTINFFDLDDEPAPPFTENEPHYRRGYHQGMASMLHAIQEGVPLDQLQAYVDGALKDWRHGNEPAFPPKFG